MPSRCDPEGFAFNPRTSVPSASSAIRRLAINTNDSDRQRKSPEDFLQDYVDMQHTFQSLSLIDQILMTMDETDRRRPLLFQLRRQLQEDEITF